MRFDFACWVDRRLLHAVGHALIQPVTIAGNVVQVVVVAGAIAVADHAAAGDRRRRATLTCDVARLEEAGDLRGGIVLVQYAVLDRLLIKFANSFGDVMPA